MNWMAQPLELPVVDDPGACQEDDAIVGRSETGETMDVEARLRWLTRSLFLIGGIFVVGLPLLMFWLWRDGFAWTPSQPEYEQMIVGIYATLGVFLIRAARDPLANASLIWFTVWSSIVHGGVMLAQAIVDDSEHHNLVGDIPALFIIAGVLGLLMPRTSQRADVTSPA